jgi:hypothetical protein
MKPLEGSAFERDTPSGKSEGGIWTHFLDRLAYRLVEVRPLP